MGLHDGAEPGGTQGDEHGVGQDAEDDDGADVLTAQALPQHEGVLRADGDDEGEPAEQAAEGDHGGTVGGCVPTGKFRFLKHL
ncbi:hypothetical protein CELD12_26950 [Cellulomonas sp. NTE-D12]|nr:hypothetical protein CELD12_26950 [Cellulomonas sp. NTE-D12]